MDVQSNKAIAEKWLEAFNDQDIQKLLSLYHPEAKHFSPKLKIRQPETKGLITGRDAMFAWWDDAFKRLPSLKYIAPKLTADKERVFIEYTRTVDDEEDMQVAEVLEIKDGLIISSRVYHG